VVRSAQGALISPLDNVRQDLFTIVRAGIEAASPSQALPRAFQDTQLLSELTSQPLHVIAAGKAAASMTDALFQAIGSSVTVRSALGVTPQHHAAGPSFVEWHQAGHPLPDDRSVAAAVRAMEIARGVAEDDCLLLLLSGGASALLACPLEGITLRDKQHVIDAMLHNGADISALNTVRKHLSAIKGGRLAALSRGRVMTLAISDVVGDDLAVIGSGPAVPDPSTWRQAADAFDQYVPSREQPAAVIDLIRKGVAGAVPDTPKPGHPHLARAGARIIAGRADAMRGARRAAEHLGYHTIVLETPVIGEARVASPLWLERAREALATADATCVISSGETVVRVKGRGKGGRNQEFALALAELLSGEPRAVGVASAGTDGIDGPTDAAGAFVSSTTRTRARALGLQNPDAYLDDNNSYEFFDRLGDLIRTGPTGTNVGDLQVLLAN